MDILVRSLTVLLEKNENCFSIFHLLCWMSTLSLLFFFSFKCNSFILSSFRFFPMSSLSLQLPLHPSSVCFHIYRSLIFLLVLLNELFPSSRISLFLFSLPFHFSGSFFFVFLWSYYFTLLRSFSPLSLPFLSFSSPPFLHSVFPPLMHSLSSIFYSPCYYCSSSALA
jgi:hypothetical protein